MAGRSASETRALTEEINAVYKAVRQEAQATAPTPGRRNTKDAEIVRLKDELISVQHRLVEATQDENASATWRSS
jgi:hypothetical protein